MIQLHTCEWRFSKIAGTPETGIFRDSVRSTTEDRSYQKREGPQGPAKHLPAWPSLFMSLTGDKSIYTHENPTFWTPKWKMIFFFKGVLISGSVLVFRGVYTTVGRDKVLQRQIWSTYDLNQPPTVKLLEPSGNLQQKAKESKMKGYQSEESKPKSITPPFFNNKQQTTTNDQQPQQQRQPPTTLTTNNDHHQQHWQQTTTTTTTTTATTNSNPDPLGSSTLRALGHAIATPIGGKYVMGVIA